MVKNASLCFVPLIFAKKYQENIFSQIISRKMLTIGRSLSKRKSKPKGRALVLFGKKVWQIVKRSLVIQKYSFVYRKLS